MPRRPPASASASGGCGHGARRAAAVGASCGAAVVGCRGAIPRVSCPGRLCHCTCHVAPRSNLHNLKTRWNFTLHCKRVELAVCFVVGPWSHSVRTHCQRHRGVASHVTSPIGVALVALAHAACGWHGRAGSARGHWHWWASAHQRHCGDRLAPRRRTAASCTHCGTRPSMHTCVTLWHVTYTQSCTTYTLSVQCHARAVRRVP